MVIRPTELETLTKGEEKLIELLEEQIDTQIRVHCDPRAKECNVHLDSFPPTRAQERIIEMYKEIGWSNVEFASSQRDGYWVTFTK